VTWPLAAIKSRFALKRVRLTKSHRLRIGWVDQIVIVKQPKGKEMQKSRFDYVKYDDVAVANQEMFKGIMADLETSVNSFTSPPTQRAKALVLTKLEEAYMWLGKLIRDDQIARNGSAERKEERKDG